MLSMVNCQYHSISNKLGCISIHIQCAQVKSIWFSSFSHHHQLSEWKDDLLWNSDTGTKIRIEIACAYTIAFTVQRCCVTAAALSINHILCVRATLIMHCRNSDFIFLTHNIIAMYGTCYWRAKQKCSISIWPSIT